MLQLTLSLSPQQQKLLKDWEDAHVCERLWQKDLSLWAGHPLTELANRLGWLDLPAGFTMRVNQLATRLPQPQGRIVLLGMGGSSLTAEVLARCHGNNRLLLLDSTHPATIQAVAQNLQDNDFFVVASKSGTTTETQALFAYFWQLAQQRWPNPAQHFLAISDAGTPLLQQATKLGIAAYTAPSDVGGRFSALSEFGLIPALLLGLQPLTWQTALTNAVERCRLPAPDNPAAHLATWLVTAAQQQHILLLESSPELAPLFAWVEQLLAESLGKQGQGLLPIYADWQAAEITNHNKTTTVVLALGQAKSRAACALTLSGTQDLAALFFVWEYAVALAGAALGVQPFDQPNVEAAKQNTRHLLDINDSPTSALKLSQASINAQRLRNYLLSSRKPLALLAFGPTELCQRDLPRLARAIARAYQRPVTIGIGPRFLHASGQLYKGSPQIAQILQVVDASGPLLPIPGACFDFGRLLQAQADGDLLALCQAGAEARRWDGAWHQLLDLFV